MNHIRTLIAISLLFTPAQARSEEQPDAKVVIAKLPTRRVLADYVSQWRSRSEHVHGELIKIPQWKPDAEIETTLKAAETAIQQLRKLIRPGASIFTYPGLLARGDIRFDPTPKPSYSLHIGIPPGWNWDHEQGTSPNEFIVRFDESGLITTIDPVIVRQ